MDTSARQFRPLLDGRTSQVWTGLRGMQAARKKQSHDLEMCELAGQADSRRRFIQRSRSSKASPDSPTAMRDVSHDPTSLAGSALEPDATEYSTDVLFEAAATSKSSCHDWSSTVSDHSVQRM
jgi:hypothetical protein